MLSLSSTQVRGNTQKPIAAATTESTQAPAGQHDHDGRDDHTERAEHVAPDLQVRAFDIQAFAAAGAEQAHGDQVDEQPQHGDHQHAGRLDFGGCLQALIGLIKDVERHRKQQQGIERRRQDFKAGIAERALAVGGALGDLDRHQGNRHGQGIGHHVRGVGQQRQAAGDKGTDHLGNHETAGQPRPSTTAVRGRRVPGRGCVLRS